MYIDGEMRTWTGSAISESVTTDDVLGFRLTTDSPPRIQFLKNGVVVNTEDIDVESEYRIAISAYGHNTGIVSCKMASNALLHLLRFYEDENKNTAYATGVTVDGSVVTIRTPTLAHTTVSALEGVTESARLVRTVDREARCSMSVPTTVRSWL